MSHDSTDLRRPHLRSAAWLIAVCAITAAQGAHAADFDDRGRLTFAADAVAVEGFEAEPWRYLPPDSELGCTVPAFDLVRTDEAIEGERLLRLDVSADCAERFLLRVPETTASYRATLWMRHGSLDAQVTVQYPEGTGHDTITAKLAPTGRGTSDGWVELASNEFPVDGTAVELVYLRLIDFADQEGVDVDGVELTLAGEYLEEADCSGVGDPVCGPERLCLYQKCRLGRLHVPPLPSSEVRDEVVDVMAGQLRVHFGGRKTRLSDLPRTLGTLEEMRSASSAWQFWSLWAEATHQLHDWHTHASAELTGRYSASRRLNVCFIEGNADASHEVWPADPRFLDLLVSHVGADGSHGLAQGDRLVAVDGLHPIEWALSLIDRDWGWWQACDDAVYAEFAERMRGLLIAYATEFTVVHCSRATGECDSTPETYRIAELPEEPDNGQVRCDNRPFYHLAEGGPNENHAVGYTIFRGRIAETSPDEAIYGMVWDTLYGGGDPQGYVNSQLSQAIAEWKASARGVILDHRAGNGGTMDSPQILSQLVRPPATAAVFASSTPFGSWDGPASLAEGVAFFEQWSDSDPLDVGSEDYDPALPVALVLHRDGSASDFMPFMLKGAPRVRLFAPHATAGAFSTFHEYYYWGGISWQHASGDTIAADGRSLIGHGVEPDVVVVQKQSDLLAGRDTLHEAALAWVRQELKP